MQHDDSDETAMAHMPRTKQTISARKRMIMLTRYDVWHQSASWRRRDDINIAYDDIGIKHLASKVISACNDHQSALIGESKLNRHQ